METHPPRAGAVHTSPFNDGAPTRVPRSDAGTAAVTSFPSCPTVEPGLAHPAVADCWPDGHPARADRWMPLTPRNKGNRT
jgi:hypothetical protein